MNHGIVPHIEFSDTERLFHALLLPVGAVVNFESLQQQEIDWDRFLELVRFHRVAGVVAHNLSDRDSRAGIPVPAPIAQQVTRAAKAQAAQALMRMKETASIAAALDHAGIDNLLVKSEAVSIRYYSSPTNRFSKDVDFLVAPENFLRAKAVLLQQGYRQSKPGYPVTDANFAAVRSMASDATFVGDKTGINIELHWRLFNNPALFDLPFAALFKQRETVMIGGTEIAVMDAANQLAYLIAHGAVHSWFRLKWLADIDRIVRGVPRETVDRSRELAATMGLKDVFAEGLTLRNIYFDPDHPVPLQGRSREVIRYVDRIAQCRSEEERNVTDLAHFFATLRHSIRLASGIRYKLWATMLHFTDVEDVGRMNLGKYGLPAYIVSGAIRRFLGAVRKLWN